MFKSSFCLFYCVPETSNSMKETEPKRLRKTYLEQAIWKKIQEIEEKKEKETDFDRLNELNNRIAFLKESLSELQGQSVPALEKELFELKKENEGLESENKGLKKTLAKFRSQYGSITEGQSEMDSSQHLFKLYRALLEKYSDLINSTERKTIGEIKSLIDPSDLTIQSLVNEYKPEKYEFERDYLSAAKKLFEFVSRRIKFVQCDLELNFWLNPKEILEQGVAEAEDLSVMLCTLLLALGDEDAEVVIAEMEDARVHAFVTTEFNGKFILLDPCQVHEFEEFSGTKTEALQNYSFEGQKVKRYLYKFNNKVYESFI